MNTKMKGSIRVRELMYKYTCIYTSIHVYILYIWEKQFDDSHGNPQPKFG